MPATPPGLEPGTYGLTVRRAANCAMGYHACLPEGFTPTSGFSTGPLIFGSGWPGIPGASGASRPVARARTWNLRFWRPPRCQLRYHRSRTERSDRGSSSLQQTARTPTSTATQHVSIRGWTHIWTAWRSRSLQPNSRRNSPGRLFPDCGSIARHGHDGRSFRLQD